MTLIYADCAFAKLAVMIMSFDRDRRHMRDSQEHRGRRARRFRFPEWPSAESATVEQGGRHCIHGCGKVRSPIAHDARALPAASPRVPASTRASHRTATRALHTRAQPSSRALRPSMLRARDFLAQPSQQPAHIADTQTAFAQHILPPHRTTHLPRSSPPRGPCPPTPDREPAPPPPS